MKTRKGDAIGEEDGIEPQVFGLRHEVHELADAGEILHGPDMESDAHLRALQREEAEAVRTRRIVINFIRIEQASISRRVRPRSRSFVGAPHELR